MVGQGNRGLRSGSPLPKAPRRTLLRAQLTEVGRVNIGETRAPLSLSSQASKLGCGLPVRVWPLDFDLGPELGGAAGQGATAWSALEARPKSPPRRRAQKGSGPATSGGHVRSCVHVAGRGALSRRGEGGKGGRSPRAAAVVRAGPWSPSKSTDSGAAGLPHTRI